MEKIRKPLMCFLGAPFAFVMALALTILLAGGFATMFVMFVVAILATFVLSIIVGPFALTYEILCKMCEHADKENVDN